MSHSCPNCEREFETKLGLGNHRSAKHGFKIDNEDWLREKYINEKMTTQEIANICNVSTTAVEKRVNNLEVGVRTHWDYKERPYTDKKKLKELYVDSDLSVREISNELDCTTFTVMEWVNKFGFEKRGRTIGERSEYANYWTDKNGYERWLTAYKDTTEHIFVHKLLAIAEYGFDKTKGSVVHHKNHIPWDNRPDNIQLMGRGEHTRYHNKARVEKKEDGGVS